MASKTTKSTRTSKTATAAKSSARSTTATSATKTSATAAKMAAASRARAATVSATAKPVTRPVSAKVAPAGKLGRKELLDRVATTTGVKRNDVRKVMDAALEEMRKAVNADSDLDISPFGKLRVVKKKDGQSGEILVCRVKLDEPQAEARKAPLAEPAE